jgi:alkylation response protein AidB-like acyl-CoA dehydrogenase
LTGHDVHFATDTDTPKLDWELAAALLESATVCGGDPLPILELLSSDSQQPPTPQRATTEALWQFLASMSSVDLTAARALEPHLDAAAILSQAGMEWEAGTVWGVFAAEASQTKLEARPGNEEHHWVLDGKKPWCSLASIVDRAVVSAHTPAGRRIFAVEMNQTSVIPLTNHWVSRGLSKVPSGTVDFTDARALPVGEAGWYLHRPGFATGAVGVAACWFGGAVGIYRTIYRSAYSRNPDQLALAWLGEADRLLATGAALLHDAARRAGNGSLGWRTAHHVRGQIAEMCERLILIAGRALGPGPLATDEDHARRVADLTIYIRQHHASRDDAALGRLLIARGDQNEEVISPW